MQAAVRAIVSVVVRDFSEIAPALRADVEIRAPFNYGNFHDDLFNRFVPTLFHIFRQSRTRQFAVTVRFIQKPFVTTLEPIR